MKEHKQYLTAPILRGYPYTDSPNLAVKCGGQFIYDHGTCRYVNQTALINDETNTSN